ncbi:MAG: hypothetical protein E7471_03490 [Ruminococcaceae bacterium]|nr:hypothetical protein [Oscillospiraceae bacterium]
MSKLSGILFKGIRGLIHLFYGNCEIIGLENIPERDVILVANHTQMNGPIVGELFLPNRFYTWCAGEMMELSSVPNYAFTDFWSQKPKWTHPFYRVLSYLIAPIAVLIFGEARTVAVYRDARILTTFKETVAHLKAGNSILIFPEKDEKHNNILYVFQENFVDVARLYYKKTGRTLTFVPMYIAPKLRRAYVGDGVKYSPDAPTDEERVRICAYLSDQITEIARNLPRHTVVPYRNIPKKHYLTNQDVTEVPK